MNRQAAKTAADIVNNYNEEELARLESKGLRTITLDDLGKMVPSVMPSDASASGCGPVAAVEGSAGAAAVPGCGDTLLIRAHGEPPSTYKTAEENGITLIDATCPVVLKLQQRIHRQYQDMDRLTQQIIIFGQKGHAEVLGLVGQTDGHALVIESADEIDLIDFSKDVFLYSQTTKSADSYRELAALIEERLQPGCRLVTANTVCGQVSHRSCHIREFASQYDAVLFVSGRKSSNGKVLFSECLDVNPRSYHIENKDDIDFAMFEGVESVGICGATSTPKWLMEECRDSILEHFK